jgi:hypothetical protein
MADGQFDVVKVARSAIEDSPPGPDHFCIFKDTENEGALTEATGDPAVFTVLFNAPVERTMMQLTADEDDWNPTDMDIATVVRMSSDAPRNLTGIVFAGVPVHAKRKTLINVGSFAITLKNLVSSDPANQFLLLGGTGDIILSPGDAQDIYYDDTNGKWRSV